MTLTYEADINTGIEQIKDRDPSIRREAIELLIGIKDGRLLYPLIKALQDEDAGVQQAAMDALIEFTDESAVHNVLPLLSDRRVSIRNMAREVLEKIGICGIELFSRHLFGANEDLRKMIADILGKIECEESVNILVELLKDPSANVRSAAAEGLGNVGDSRVVDNLIELLNERWVSLFAARSLGRLRDKRAIKPLTRLLRSPYTESKIIAIEALSSIGGDDALDGILDALDDISPDVINEVVKGVIKITRGNIEKVIERFGKEKFFNVLQEIIHSNDIDKEYSKEWFIKALSHYTDGTDLILHILSETDPEDFQTMDSALEALLYLRDEEELIKALSSESKTCLVVVLEVLAVLKSSKAIPTIISLFDNVDRDVKIKILDSLGGIGGRDAIVFLIDMLSYEEGHIRKAAAKGLGTMEDTKAIPHLLGSLDKEEYFDVAEEIVKAIIKINQKHGGEKLYESLLPYLSSKKPFIKEIVINNLGKAGWAVIGEYAKKLICDENWRVRKACVEVLGRLHPHGTEDLLLATSLDEKEEVRIAVAEVAGNYKLPEMIDLLVTMFQDKNSIVVCKAIDGLVNHRVTIDPYPLLELLEREDHLIKKAAIWALGELQIAEAQNKIKEFINHADEDLRTTASIAYEKIKVANDVST